jgi:hypothetical protein
MTSRAGGPDRTVKEAISDSIFDNSEVVHSKWYAWGPVTAGRRAIFEGARCTLYSDGNALLDAAVSGGPGTWAIWQVQLLDGNHAVLGAVLNRHTVAGRSPAFEPYAPSDGRPYRFFGRGYFDRNLYPFVNRINLVYR